MQRLRQFEVSWPHLVHLSVLALTHVKCFQQSSWKIMQTFKVTQCGRYGVFSQWACYAFVLMRLICDKSVNAVHEFTIKVYPMDDDIKNAVNVVLHFK